jgi:hexosaminidase
MPIITSRHPLAVLPLWLFLGASATCAQDTLAAPAIIPQPSAMEVDAGVFLLGPKTEIWVEANKPNARRIGESLSAVLSKATGYQVPVRNSERSSPPRGHILLLLKETGSLGPEGYDLTIRPDGIQIQADAPSGLFYGVQTLRQMLPAEPRRTGLTLPCLKIQDKPRFRWRGLMLDNSRTFLSMDYLERSVDRMALYKLNILHLHLTDDQGWRLEIKKYPKLTSIGSRFDARTGGGGGYYTQEEMRNLVQYASARNITIVPEIEMPGHSVEVLTAYPDLACPYPARPPLEIVPWKDMFGGHPHHTVPLCAGNERVYQVYQDILSEVIGLFPSEFIHLGGDEVPKEAWKQCPRCQARMKAEGLKDENELQSYFIKRMARFVAEKGRRAIGWDEILEGGLAPGAAVMSWRGIEGGIAAAKMGHDVVMTPSSHCYLDYSVLRLPVERVYSYEAIPAELNGQLAERVIGVQGSMWTHLATNDKATDYQIYPRLLALAEVAWSPAAGRNWPEFDSRLAGHLKRLETLGIKYYNPAAYAAAIKIGSWQAQELEGESPHVLEWDVTRLVNKPGEYEVQIRGDASGPSGQGTTQQSRGQRRAVFVQSIALLEDGQEISREMLPGSVSAGNFQPAWVKLANRKPGAAYAIRTVVTGVPGNDVTGSVWLLESPGK